MNKDLIILLNKAYFYLKFRPRTEKEMRDYLYKKVAKTHWSRDDAEKIIEELKKQNLINDKKFIDLYVRDRTALKPKGKRLLIRELKQKGIKDELIEKYFSENEVDEEKLAFSVLRKRWDRFQSFDKNKKYEKATRFLLNRGFDFEIIRKTIAELINKE